MKREPDRRWITVQFVASSKPRAVHYAVLDFTLSMTPAEVKELKPTVITEPVLGVLVQHLIDADAGLCESRVVWAVMDSEFDEIVPATEVAEGTSNLQYIGTFDANQVPRPVDPFLVGVLHVDAIKATELHQAAKARHEARKAGAA